MWITSKIFLDCLQSEIKYVFFLKKKKWNVFGLQIIKKGNFGFVVHKSVIGQTNALGAQIGI